MAAARAALARGDLSSAERLCASAVAADAGQGWAWLLLTETALLRQRPDAAIKCAERAVALLPHDPLAHILRAKCLLVSGAAAAARRAAEAAAQLPLTSAAPLDALGAIFGLLGQHARARQLCERAVAARPQVPQYLFNLAVTERTLGHLAAAESGCDAAIALQPRFCLAHYLRADLRTQTRARNHVPELESLLAAGGLAAAEKVALHFALGKELEDLGEHGRAFEQFAAGCTLQRRSIAYDAAAEIAAIERIVATQDRAGLTRCASSDCQADPVFITGLPRSGTTLIERMIGSHSAMTAVGESNAFAAELRHGLHDLGRRYIAAAAAWSSSAHCGRLLDKTLQNYLHCGLIHAVLPRAKIILVRRDPLDVCWSLYKAHFQDKFSFSYDQLELADYFLAFRRLARHWRVTLPAHALLEVQYEDLVADPAVQSRRLIEFLGLPWEQAVLRFHESAAPSATASAVQVRHPVHRSAVGKWRNHAGRLTALRERLATEIPPEELTPQR
ncbi:MAG TPA: sulfotransferase [Steroidobacteraceae bacterium]|jgi:tetratricopeptide (TPR) repeat protein|nr:sulfotransferase [Steroidobacteraceae bacterium]